MFEICLIVKDNYFELGSGFIDKVIEEKIK